MTQSPVDIQTVLAQSTSDVAVTELSRKGFKKVKVLNQRMIGRLIQEAVDRVIAARQEEIGREERSRILNESRAEFERIIRERLTQERSRQDEASQRLQSEADALRAALTKRDEDLQAAQERLRAQEQALAERDGRLRELEAERSAPAGEDLQTVFKSLIHELRSERQKQQTTDVSEIKRSIEGLAQSISDKLTCVASGGGSTPVSKDVVLDALFRLDEEQRPLESNLRDVSVKEAKASGVKGTLAKLKSLQQGGSDGS